MISVVTVKDGKERMGVPFMSKVHMKGRTIQILEERGPSWDYDIAKQVIDEYELQDDRRNRSNIRIWLIEYAANGLIEAVEDAVDDGSNFREDKLMSRYQVTNFGRQRMKDTGLL